jgi:ApbE superfamily uncharacterized protein (UPF0280 family)
MYEERTYRRLVKSDDLVAFEVVVKETDLLIRARKDLSKEARESVLRYRHQLEAYIRLHPMFRTSLVPLEEDAFAPEIARTMIQASREAGVGPMAAVAGAVAEAVGRDLLQISDEVIVENGGDIYLSTAKERTVGLYAGRSPLSLKVGVLVGPETSPLGICTSSGTVGPSLSFGKADAVCVLSDSAALADAAATSIGNVVRDENDIERGLRRGREIEGVWGIVIVVGDKMGVWGNVRLIRL